MNIHHAPWSRRFTTFYCRGQFAHELQIGPVVIQWFYESSDHRRCSTIYSRGRLHVWKDRYWR